jgi:hypothetical protein
MPGPTTEILNEDIRELKADIRDIRGNLDVLKADVHRLDIGLAELRIGQAEIRAEFNDLKVEFKEFKGDIRRLDVGLAELRAEFRFAKWLLGLLLAMTLSGIGGGIWWAATITAEVRHVGQAVAAQKAPSTPPAGTSARAGARPD